MRHCHTRVGSSGFTLIELVIIILIIGILSYFAMPRLDFGGPKVAAVAKKLVEDLRYTQNHAVTTQIGHRMVFAGCDGGGAGCTQYQVEFFDAQAAQWSPAQDPLGAQGGFIVRMTNEFDGVALNASTLPAQTVEFQPSGSPVGLAAGSHIDVQVGTHCERVAITPTTGLISQTPCP